MASVNQTTATKDTFHHYLLFWLGQLGSLLGSSIVEFALIYWITIESRSATILSITAFLSILPRIFVTFFAGVWIDRLDRKKIIIFTDFCQALATLILFFLFLFNLQSVWVVLGIIIIRSVFQSIHRPTVAAIIPVMIPKEKLSRMNSINMIASSAIFTIGPIVSGILIGFMDIKFILWIDVGSFLIAVIPTLLITIPSILGSSKLKEKKTSFIYEMKEGYHIIMQIRGMFAFFMMAIIGNFLLSPSGVLRPYFISIYHEGDAKILSYLSAVSQIAMICGAILIAIKKNWKHKSIIMIVAQFLVGTGYLITGLASKSNFVIIGLGLFILAFGIPIINSLYMTILQEKVPLDKQGRVNAMDMALSFSIMPISSLIAGPLAELIGINILFIILAGSYMVITLLFAFFSDYRQVDKGELLSDYKEQG
ncbi:MFS transporter [Candidatus Lokiarchaeum ossiferum]|uniref:MFS transporter n=1 Tax=Candidatus Lokiarchaeum ossiferum TaxID=2951803 RepID=UPI00352BDFE9